MFPIIIFDVIEFDVKKPYSIKNKVKKYISTRRTRVLIFCFGFRELSHLTCDLSQAEKKINVVQSEQMHKMTSISLKMVIVVILSENSCHFVTC